MSDQEAARTPGGSPKAKAKVMGGQTGTVLSVSGTFTSGRDVSLDMAGIDDMGGDTQVDIYAASTATPSARGNGTALRRGHYAPAPANFPMDLNGGPWTSNGNYWVQVAAPDGTWQGHITATRGTHTITLTKQTF